MLLLRLNRHNTKVISNTTTSCCSSSSRTVAILKHTRIRRKQPRQQQQWIHCQEPRRYISSFASPSNSSNGSMIRLTSSSLPLRLSLFHHRATQMLFSTAAPIPKSSKDIFPNDDDNNNNHNRLKQKQKAILFQSLGCPRNWVDTEVMLGMVLKEGYTLTQDISQADYAVINTCGFLKIARDESTEEIEHVLSSKKDGGKLIVTGCMVNLYKDEIITNYPEIDHVLGSGSIDQIVKVIQQLEEEQENDNDEKTVRTTNEYIQEQEQEQEEAQQQQQEYRSFLETYDTPQRHLATPKHYAYLKISEGCKKRCSFCIIPKIKGPLRSKPQEQIIQECQTLLDQGTQEIIFIAQDLGDYGKDFASSSPRDVGPGGLLPSMLHNLLQSIPNDDDNMWIRLLYLYPDEITDELIQIIKHNDRICNYLDMPIQHINDTLLKRMNRKHTSSQHIRRTIEKLREEIPDITIRTSLMVGFPGETHEQFEELCDFVKDVQLDNVGVFQYSNEPLSVSARKFAHDQVSNDIKQERYETLMQLQKQIVLQKNQQRVENKQVYNVVLDGIYQKNNDNEKNEQEGQQVIYQGRYYGQCPDIDSHVYVVHERDTRQGRTMRRGGLAAAAARRRRRKSDSRSNIIIPQLGQRYNVEIIDYIDYDLVGRIIITPL